LEFRSFDIIDINTMPIILSIPCPVFQHEPGNEVIEFFFRHND
jgi:hypothetical protein